MLYCASLRYEITGKLFSITLAQGSTVSTQYLLKYSKVISSLSRN